MSLTGPVLVLSRRALEASCIGSVLPDLLRGLATQVRPPRHAKQGTVKFDG